MLPSFTALAILALPCGSARASAGADVQARPPPDFGRDMLTEFNLSPGFTNLNHGSFGSVPKQVHQAMWEYELQAEGTCSTRIAFL
eukprot:gene12124-2212_t